MKEPDKEAFSTAQHSFPSLCNHARECLIYTVFSQTFFTLEQEAVGLKLQTGTFPLVSMCPRLNAQ